MNYYILYYKNYNHFVEEEQNEQKAIQKVTEIINNINYTDGDTEPILIKGDMLEYNIVKPKIQISLKQNNK